MLGNLLEKRLVFRIEAKCAQSGRAMEISLDSDLDILQVTEGADPMLCVPIVQLADTNESSIVDIF